MTDSHAAYLVVLRDDYREDGLGASTLAAISMIHGVISVVPVEAEYGQVVARIRRDRLWAQALIELARLGPPPELPGPL